MKETVAYLQQEPKDNYFLNKLFGNTLLEKRVTVDYMCRRTSRCAQGLFVMLHCGSKLEQSAVRVTQADFIQKLHYSYIWMDTI